MVLEWLAADYAGNLIRAWLRERGWPSLTDATLSAYRKRNAARIEALRAERRDSALTTGLALKEERVARLVAHADELDAIKWRADPKTGRLWNEKAWRETLDDIARETGGRAQNIDLMSGGQPIALPIHQVIVHLPTASADTDGADGDESVAG